MMNTQFHVVIPARAGSKGVVGKNLAQIAGISLVGRTIAFARELPGCQGVYVSTDGDEIASESEKWGATVIARPAAISRDSSSAKEVVHHFLGAFRSPSDSPASLMYLEPTYIGREQERCIDTVRLLDQGADSAAVFKPAPHPDKLWQLKNSGKSISVSPLSSRVWLRRQDLEGDFYTLTGEAYAIKAQSFISLAPDGLLFGRVGAIVGSPSLSVDVNTTDDLAFARRMLEEKAKDD